MRVYAQPNIHTTKKSSPSSPRLPRGRESVHSGTLLRHTFGARMRTAGVAIGLIRRVINPGKWSPRGLTERTACCVTDLRQLWSLYCAATMTDCAHGPEWAVQWSRPAVCVRELVRNYFALISSVPIQPSAHAHYGGFTADGFDPTEWRTYDYGALSGACQTVVPCTECVCTHGLLSFGHVMGHTIPVNFTDVLPWAASIPRGARNKQRQAADSSATRSECFHLYGACNPGSCSWPYRAVLGISPLACQLTLWLPWKVLQ